MGAGVMNSENNGRLRWQDQPRGRRSVRERVVPRVQSKLSRALHAHRGKKLLQHLQNLKNTTMKRDMVTFREAREKGTMTCVECMPGGLVRRHDGGLPVEGDLR